MDKEFSLKGEVALVTGSGRGLGHAIATRLAEKRELYGDELVELLDAQDLVKPELDYTKEETWPKM